MQGQASTPFNSVLCPDNLPAGQGQVQEIEEAWAVPSLEQSQTLGPGLTLFSHGGSLQNLHPTP